MLPQGAIWQELRQRALDTVQSGAEVSFSSPPNLQEWLQFGAFSVQDATRHGFTLHASSAEVGSALLSEALYSADHAMEHAVSLRNQLACGRWSSPAWTTVTFYYWGYHLAVALTRLLGKTVWFVSPALASQLGSLAGSGVARPGSGPYVLECGATLSATHREVTIKRSAQTRAHDAVWNVWFAELRACTKAAVAGKAGGAEARLYLSLISAANVLGDTWPSDLRNALNYGIAVAYGAIRKNTPSAIYKTVLVDPPSTVTQMIARLEANASGLVYGLPLTQQVPFATRVLVDTAFAMEIVLRVLLDEVSERRGIDRRWANARSAFARHHARGFDVESWPCRDDDEAIYP